jgi:hypothetical protein
VNENKALRQGIPQQHPFATPSSRPHSPTKVSLDAHPIAAKPMILVPKPSAANPQKPKILPALSPIAADDAPETDAPKAHPRERVARIPAPARRHSVEPMTEAPEFPEIIDDAVSDDAITKPAPIIQVAKRSVKKPLPP